MKILVVELHHLGDAVISLPFVKAAMRGHEVFALCRPRTAEAYSLLLPEKRILSWDPPWESAEPHRGVWAEMRARARMLGEFGFDAGVCVWADARVSALMTLARIPARIGFPVRAKNFYAPKPAWRRRRLRIGRGAELILPLFLGGPLLTRPLFTGDSEPVQLGKWRQIGEALGTGFDESVPWVEPGKPPEAVERFVGRAREQGRPVLLVHPGGRLVTKRWAVERFESLLCGESPAVAGCAVLVIEVPGEPSLQRLPEGSLRFAPRSVRELYAVTGACDVCLCNDSLVSHLAAAAGKRVVSIFGSGDPAWFAPAGNSRYVVASGVCPHRPCVDRCLMPSVVCLESVAVRDVSEILSTALADQRSAGYRA